MVNRLRVSVNLRAMLAGDLVLLVGPSMPERSIMMNDDDEGLYFFTR